MYRILSTVLALLVAGVISFLIVLRRKRAEFSGLPAPPMKNWLVGHLHIAGDCASHFPAGIHVHNWARYIQKKYGQGEVFYLDWWPLGPRWLLISDPEIISQYITSTQSLPKSKLETDYLGVFLGEQNMVSVEGQHWKNLRTMFNPGFASNHLMTLVPYIVDASLVFHDVIRKKAEDNELFELEEYGTRLTIDIIGKVVLDSDFDSQKQVHPIVQAFRDRVRYMPMGNSLGDILSNFELLRRYRLYRNGVKLDRLIGEELDRKVASRTNAAQANGHTSDKPTSFKDRKRSVIDLALDAYQKEFSSTSKPGAPMDATFRQAAIDSMKTFIFAGHDTTASTIAYLFYLLHWHPKAHARVVAELDSVFGKAVSVQSIADQIKGDPYTVNKMEFTTAVIKETLRMFPPASTLRYDGGKKDLTFPYTDPKDPTRTIHLPLSGFDIWPIVHLVSRNEKYFPQPYRFVPERHLPKETPFPEAGLGEGKGRDAYRPFEKGPRSCIGEQLAMLEMKIIVAMTVREFDFTCEFNGKSTKDPWREDGEGQKGPGGNGEGKFKGENQETYIEVVKQKQEWDGGKARWSPENGGKKIGQDGQWLGRTIEGHECWQILLGAAKPRGGMPGRMRLR